MKFTVIRATGIFGISTWKTKNRQNSQLDNRVMLTLGKLNQVSGLATQATTIATISNLPVKLGELTRPTGVKPGD